MCAVMVPSLRPLAALARRASRSASWPRMSNTSASMRSVGAALMYAAA